MDEPAALPTYDHLRHIDALDGNVSWGVFGPQDELGTLNLLTAERVRRAIGEVRRGAFFNLSLPLDEPAPAKAIGRGRYRHRVFPTNRNVQDDVLDNFYPQASSQIDGFRHVAAREFGFYNEVDATRAGPDGDRLGIDRMAQHGIVGRGVLADIAARWDGMGIEIALDANLVITPELLAETLEAEGVELEPGDILLVRTGYLRAIERIERSARPDLPRLWPGLSAREPMARFLWDAGVALVGSDNPGVEARPGDSGYLHRRLLSMLGMPLAELLVLDELAADCSADGQYAFLFAAVPLNLPGGVGSPANAFVLK